MFTECRTCRFCGESAPDGELVKYEVRHYAHHACYLDAGKPLRGLWAWQIHQFPYALLKARGLLPELTVIESEELARATVVEHRMAMRAAQ